MFSWLGRHRASVGNLPEDTEKKLLRYSVIQLFLKKAYRFFVSSVRGTVTAVFDTFVLLRLPASISADAVCLVRLDGIGDFLLWLQSAKQLRAHFKERKIPITLIANSAWAQWARELDLADDVWEVEVARFFCDWSYRAEWLRKARVAGFTKAINATHSRVINLEDSFIRATKAPERIGSSGDSINTPGWLKRWADMWYTRLIPCGNVFRMELLRNADFMRGLGFTDFLAGVPELNDSGKLLVPRELSEKPYAVLAPGAGWGGKVWPAASYVEIARRLSAHGLRVVIAGSRSERPITETIIHSFGNELALDLVGRTTLSQMAAVLRQAEVVVSNDTGSAHLSAAVGTPVICILGGGHYGRFLPYQVEAPTGSGFLPHVVAKKMDCFNCNWQCVFIGASGQPVRCIREVAVDTVWYQVRRVLDSRNLQAPRHFLTGTEFRQGQQ